MTCIQPCIAGLKYPAGRCGGHDALDLLYATQQTKKGGSNDL